MQLFQKQNMNARDLLYFPLKFVSQKFVIKIRNKIDGIVTQNNFNQKRYLPASRSKPIAFRRRIELECQN